MITACLVILTLGFVVLGGTALALLVRKVLFVWIALGVALFAARQAKLALNRFSAKRANRRVTHRAVPVSNYRPAPGTIYC